jgi:hypothetical protein
MTSVAVARNYSPNSGHSGQELRKNHQAIVYTPQGDNNRGRAGLMRTRLLAITKGFSKLHSTGDKPMPTPST